MKMDKYLQDSNLQRPAFYGRYSTSKQDEGMQITAAKLFCTKYGINFNENLIYLDEATSAVKLEMKRREQLMRLLSDLDAGKFDFILAYSESRLARDPVEHARIRLLLHGVPIILCDTETVYNPLGLDVLSRVIRDGVSKFEVDQTSERTRDTFISKIRAGKQVNKHLPYGYVTRDGVFTMLPAQRLEVRKIFELYGQGIGFASIARELEWYQKDQVTPNKERVKCIIINPFYAGFLSMNKVMPRARLSVRERSEWHEGFCPAIEPVVTIEEWNRCFSIYSARKRREISPLHYRTSFLLSGILRCPKCGDSVVGKNQIKRKNGSTVYGWRYYFCARCDYSIDASYIHHYVLSEILPSLISRSTKEWGQIKEKVLNSIDQDLTGLIAERGQIQNQIEDVSLRLMRATGDLGALIDVPDTSKEQKVMDDYRHLLEDRLIHLKETVKQITSHMSTLEHWRNNEVNLERVRVDALREERLRPLLLALLRSVTVNVNKEVDIVARVHT